MTSPSRTSSRRCVAAGLTLIEVIAAIAILGTVLVGIVMAKGRHMRQMALTHRQADIVSATDDLISRWWLNGQTIPAPRSGTLSGDPTLVWQTRLVTHPVLKSLEAQVVRLEVFDTRALPGEQVASSEPIIQMDLVVSMPPADKPATQPASPAGAQP